MTPEVCSDYVLLLDHYCIHKNSFTHKQKIYIIYVINLYIESNTSQMVNITIFWLWLLCELL